MAGRRRHRLHPTCAASAPRLSLLHADEKTRLGASPPSQPRSLSTTASQPPAFTSTRLRGIEEAIAQPAEILARRHHAGELAQRGHQIAAVLRF
jgi:hypothetical protein